MTETPNITRRNLLKGACGLVVSFSMIGKVAAAAGQSEGTVKTGPLRRLKEGIVESYLAIDEQGRVTVYSGKIDFGTGVRTGLAQMAAEELSVPYERVTIIEGDTALTPDQGPTYGSTTIQEAGVNLRHAAATARQALLMAAARQLSLDKADLHIEDGVVKGQGKQIDYGELSSRLKLGLDVDEKAPLKDPADYATVGKSFTRRGLPGKITGGFVYMQDYRVPDMVYGVVVRPPAVSATLESVDEDSIVHLSGIIKIIAKKGFLGVVARDEWTAIRAGREIKVRWSTHESLPDPDKLWEHIRDMEIVKDDVTSDVGDAKGAFNDTGKQLHATYDFGIQTHGSIGPSCSIADFRNGKLISWSSSQATHRLRRQLADMFSMDENDIRCFYIEGAGCYGRNGHEDAAADAALLSREVGLPVRVQWMRHDEHGWDPKGPPTLIDISAQIDDDNHIKSWYARFFLPQGGGGRVALLPAELSDMPTETELNPGAVTKDSAIPYKFPNVLTVCHRLQTTPLRPSWIRAPGRMQNTFANETFFDELAAKIKADPIAFRRRHIDPEDERGHEVLDRLEKITDWQAGPCPRQEREGNILFGRGAAYVRYDLNRTYIAGVAEVEVDKYSGHVRVTRFHVVQDCGQIINPESVKSQLEGNIIQTTSRSLMEEVAFNRESVTSLDWASYPILRFKDVPEINIELINRPNDPPWGVGEPASVIVSACISNAIFDASGARLRSVPFKADKVKAALGRV